MNRFATLSALIALTAAAHARAGSIEALPDFDADPTPGELSRACVSDANDSAAAAPTAEDAAKTAVEALENGIDPQANEVYCEMQNDEGGKPRASDSTTRKHPQFSGSASFYDPDDASDRTAGTRRLADTTTRWVNDCSVCAVRVARYHGLCRHQLRVCLQKDPKKCVSCVVHDNGPGVRGVDLAPNCFRQLAPLKTGRINVIISDHGLAPGQKACFGKTGGGGKRSRKPSSKSRSTSKR